MKKEKVPSKIVVVKTEAEYQAALAEVKGSVALEFTSTDCEFCDEEMPLVDALVPKCNDLTVLRVDVDDLPALADQYLGEEGGTPTIFFSKTAAGLEPGKAKELEDSSALKRRMKCAR